MQNFKTLMAVLCLSACAIAAHGQAHTAIASGGGTATGATGNVNYTIGQVFYTTNTSAGGREAGGIQATINLNNPLPVTFLNFSGSCDNGKVTMGWQTGAELNNNFFEVEKSDDANNWASIATVKGNSESKTYAYTDERPNAVISYYRIKQVDVDGKFSYSQTVYVMSCGADKQSVLIYPNPTSSGVYISTEHTDDMDYELYDMKGAMISHGKLQAGATYVNMAGLAAAPYYLKVKQNNIELNNFKIIKN